MNCFVTEGGWGCWCWGGKNHIFAWHLDPVHLIWTKFGMDKQVDPRNKPVGEFFIFLKIQDGRLRSKVQNRPNMTLQYNTIQIVYLKSKQIDIHTGSSEKVGIAYCWDFGREYRNLI